MFPLVFSSHMLAQKAGTFFVGCCRRKAKTTKTCKGSRPPVKTAKLVLNANANNSIRPPLIALTNRKVKVANFAHSFYTMIKVRLIWHLRMVYTTSISSFLEAFPLPSQLKSFRGTLATGKFSDKPANVKS